MTKAKKPADGVHHLLKFIYQELRVQEMSLRTLATRSGVSYNTLKDALQNRSNISLASIEAALNTLGFTVKPTTLVRYEAKATPILDRSLDPLPRPKKRRLIPHRIGHD